MSSMALNWLMSSLSVRVFFTRSSEVPFIKKSEVTSRNTFYFGASALGKATNEAE